MAFKENITVFDKIRGLGYAIEYLVTVVVSALADPAFYQTKDPDFDNRREFSALLSSLAGKVPLT